MITESYMARLERLRAERKLEQDLKNAPPLLSVTKTLEGRIESWYWSLPVDRQQDKWTMKQLRAIFNETPQKLGMALFSLGWTRKRLWRDETPLARYWFRNPSARP